jgi:very-short-patch-repair endonuclease
VASRRGGGCSPQSRHRRLQIGDDEGPKLGGVSELRPPWVVQQPNQAAVAVATAQQGVISRSQLLDVGLSAEKVKWWARTGRLHRIHRGVYALGHPVLSLRARWIAALLACGPSSMLSHRSAGVHHGLIEDDQRVIDVTTTGGRGSLQGVRVHRRRLEAARHDGLPVTAIDQTLRDLATQLTARGLERAVDEAHRRGHALSPQNSRGRRGAASLNALAARNLHGHTVTRSELEERFLKLTRNAHLPDPELNIHVETFLVDAVWRHHRLVVELDGARYHDQPGVRASDRRRDAALTIAGWRVVRFGWEDVTAHERRTAAELTALLATMPACVPSPPRTT